MLLPLLFSGLALRHNLRREHYSVSISVSVFMLTHFVHSPFIQKTFLSISLQVNITATLGTLNVAAAVNGVKIKGDGEMHMTLSSSLLPNLNRQLQFVTYTNTLFHPSTADTGERVSSDLSTYSYFLLLVDSGGKSLSHFNF